MPDKATVVCPHCTTTNQVPTGPGTVACGQCGKVLFTGQALTLDDGTFDAQVAASDLPVVVVFWAGWSVLSKSLVKAARKVAAGLEPDCRLALVNIEEEQKLTARLAVRAVPSIFVYVRGEEVARHSGPLAEGDLKQWVQEGFAPRS